MPLMDLQSLHTTRPCPAELKLDHNRNPHIIIPQQFLRFFET